MTQFYRYADDLLDEALELARSGATRGMITSQLKQRGVAAEVAAAVAHRALRNTTLKNRRRGMMKMTGGLGSIAVGISLFSFTETGVRLGVVLIVFGMLGAGNGFVDMISGTDQKSKLV